MHLKVYLSNNTVAVKITTAVIVELTGMLSHLATRLSNVCVPDFNRNHK